MGLVARTASDVRDVMVEGESGILSVCPPWFRPEYNPSNRKIIWPNGAMALTYSADEPDILRGKQFDGVWADELASWRYPEAWDMLMLGLRLGGDPQAVVTTTPRPTKLITSLVNEDGVVVTTGHTYENADNLAPAFIDSIRQRYEGTRLGRQEIYAEILNDNPGALWRRDQIEVLRVRHAPEMRRIVVAIDPAVTSAEDNNETGIVVAGVGQDGHLYVLDDLSVRATPHGWASRAVFAYHKHRADRIVGEHNQGGEMVEHTIRTVDDKVAYKGVHASRGKYMRAEPVAALYEQGRAHHVGVFAELEDQMCQWQPGDASPDRLDALVWAATDLMLGDQRSRKLVTW